LNGAGGVDAAGGTSDLDAQRRDEDDLERLRRQEAALGEAYRRSPGDMATMGALVRVQQAICRHEEDAARVANNALPS
jgi:hypothetical protein